MVIWPHLADGEAEPRRVRFKAVTTCGDRQDSLLHMSGWPARLPAAVMVGPVPSVISSSGAALPGPGLRPPGPRGGTTAWRSWTETEERAARRGAGGEKEKGK